MDYKFVLLNREIWSAWLDFCELERLYWVVSTWWVHHCSCIFAGYAPDKTRNLFISLSYCLPEYQNRESDWRGSSLDFLLSLFGASFILNLKLIAYALNEYQEFTFLSGKNLQNSLWSTL